MIRAICSSILFLQLVEPAVCQMALSGLIVMTIADNCAHVLLRMQHGFSAWGISEL